MATHAAELRIQRRRVEDIEGLVAQIARQQHLAAHLLTVTFRAFYYFFTAACLTVGIVTLVNGKTSAAAAWGGTGLFLLLVLFVVKAISRLLRWAAGTIREELAEAFPGVAAKTAEAAQAAQTGETAETRETAKVAKAAGTVGTARAGSRRPPPRRTTIRAIRPGRPAHRRPIRPRH